jgi:MoxR-like ATPase
MTSDQFVAWLERKLHEHGAGKVVPDAATLQAQAREAIAANIVRERAAALEAAAWAEAEAVALPRDLDRRAWAVLAAHPELSWEEAVEIAMAPTIERGAA